MHQVFCRLSNKTGDVQCPICRQGFTVAWSRYSLEEQKQSVRLIEASLRDHHDSGLASASEADDPYHIHPATGFNVPEWSGSPSYSAAALLNAPGE